MPRTEHPAPTAAHPDPATTLDMDATLFAALELSLSSWVVVARAPGDDKAGKHGVAACDGPGLLALLDRLRERAERRCGWPVAVVVMQEAGRDGFWVHRLLEAHGVQSLVVDPSSIAVNRRSRRAKTDRIDAEAMLRTLMAWSRGERQVCAMVRAPTREAEDARRLHREREALLAERIRHANRIKGLLATQGVFGFEPTGRDRRTRLAELRTPEGAALLPRLLAEVGRQVDRLELAMQQLAAVEAERVAAFAAERVAISVLHDVGEPKGPPGARTRRQRSRFCPAARDQVPACCGCVVSALRPLPCWRARRSSATSATGARWRRMPGWPQARGRAVASTTSRASPRRATTVSAAPWDSSPGCGCATSRIVRSASGIASGCVTAKVASSASPSQHWRASFWWHCGALSPRA